MFSIAITERGGSLRQLEFDKTELSIGRLEENEIVLPKNNVSKHHARVQFRDGSYVLLDLKSTNGTYVNGRKITAPTVLGPGDKVYIGDYVLSFRDIATPAEEADPRRTRELRPVEPRGHAGADDAAPLGAGKHSAAEDGATRINRGRRPQPPKPPAVATGRSGSAQPGLSQPGAPQSWSLKSATGRSLTPTGVTLGRPPIRKEALSSSLTAALQASKAAEAQVRAAALAAGRTQSISVPPAPEIRDEGGVAIAQAEAPLERDRASDDPTLISGEWPAAVRTRKATALQGQVPLPLSGGVPPEGAEDGAVSGTQERLPAGHAESLDTGAPVGEASTSGLSPEAQLRVLMERVCRERDVFEGGERMLGVDERRVLEQAFDDLVREGELPPQAERGFLLPAAIGEAGGLGPLDRMLETRTLRELVVYGPDCILADFGFGEGLAPVSASFSCAAALQAAARRLCARGRRDLGSEGSVEVALPDGGIAVVLQPPVSQRGLVLSLRRPPRSAPSVQELLDQGVLSRDMLDVVERALDARRNIVVVGAQQSGMSTLLSALASRFASDERVVAIEAMPSLVMAAAKPVVLRAEPSQSGVARALRSASWLRPERLVIDDIALDQLPEALPLFAARSGVLAGVHVASAASDDAAQLAVYPFGHGYPAAGPQFAAAFQLRLHLVFADGRPRVREVTELRASASGELDLVRVMRGGALEAEAASGHVEGHELPAGQSGEPAA